MPELYNFLDVEAIVRAEDEEELDDEEEDFCELLNDDELNLKDEQVRVVARARPTRSSYTKIPLPLQVLCSTEPSIWSVRVKPSKIHPPAITSAFARPSIPGYVFIEAFDIEAAVHAVKGFVTEYSLHDPICPLRSRLDNWCGVWQDNIVMMLGGKRKRDGQPAPHVWTAAELIQQYGNGKVKVLGSNNFVFGGSMYEDGLIMEHIPLSYLHKPLLCLQPSTVVFGKGSGYHLNHTPPPEDIPRTLMPDPEEPDGSTVYPRSSSQELAWTQWLFAEEIQGVLREECIPFHIRGIPASSPHAGLNGLTAKMVPVTSQKILPEPKEVVVSVVQKKRPTQISIEPSYLEPWMPSEGNKVGKLILLEHGFCIIKLESSGEYMSAAAKDIVNGLRR
ncbi:hypothetical protein EI94DRAFT_1702525 [Lactarius quietus]|nr:hypothetical protein EI94DRAFT_1702525 [Lactarius quietus]